MKEDGSIQTAIFTRISGEKHGKCFSRSDFSNLGNRAAISQALSRLERSGRLVSPLRGYYHLPRTSQLLGIVMPPDYEELASAIARSHGWTILPCGDILLNQLGISTQVPAVWSFVSDGPYRDFQVGKITLTFKHTANKEIFNLSRKTAMVVQAIKALGQDHVGNKELSILRERLAKEERRALASEATRTTSWIYELLKKIAAEEGEDA